MTDQHPNTCNIKGELITLIYKFTNKKDNLYVEIIENHKRSSAIIDQEMLSKLNQLSEEKRLRRFYGASLVLSFENILEWGGGSGYVVEEVKVYNYSNASTVDKNLIRSEDELEKIQEELQEGDPLEILNEDPYEPKGRYLIFGEIHSIDDFIDANENV